MRAHQINVPKKSAVITLALIAASCLLTTLPVEVRAEEATVISFTSDEGYVDGPLDKQPAKGHPWKEQRGGDYQVSTSDGSLLIEDSAGPYREARFGKAIPGNTSVSQSVDFRITRAEQTPAESATYFRLTLTDSTAGNLVGVAALFRQSHHRENVFSIGIFANVDGNKWENSPGIPGQELGLTDQSSESDLLRMTMTTVPQGTAGEWQTEIVLENLDKQTEVRRVVLLWTPGEAWSASEKFLRLDTADLGEQLMGGAVKIEEIGVKAVP